MRTAAERREADHNTREAIAAARKTAQLSRLLWPDADDEPLHSKVEILTRRLLAANQQKATSQVARFAHPAAWRKYKHTHSVRDTGDVTQAGWYRDAQAAQEAAEDAVCVARNVLRLAEDSGDTDAARRLINAAYWAAKDLMEAAEDAQAEIPCIDNDDVIFLFQQMEEVKERLQGAKDDLISCADARDYTITRNPT